jgi:hypothetical protein
MRFQAKRVFVVLLLCATVDAQTGALLAAREQHKPTQHCCVRCHAGPLPFLQTTATAAIAPVFHVAWLESNPHRESARDVFAVARSSRAPPA